MQAQNVKQNTSSQNFENHDAVDRIMSGISFSPPQSSKEDVSESEIQSVLNFSKIEQNQKITKPIKTQPAPRRIPTKTVPVRFMKDTKEFCEMLDTFSDDSWVTSFLCDPNSTEHPYSLQVNQKIWENYINKVHGGEEVQVVMVGGCSSHNVPVVFTS